MHLSPDEIIYWQYGVIKMSATLVFTWVIMAILVVSAYFITRNLNKKNHHSRWQNALEIIVITINDQISDAGLDKPRRYMGFLGTLFLFIAMANLLTIFPGFEPPSSSLSTTLALAFCVFVSVPFYGIKKQRGETISTFLHGTHVFHVALQYCRRVVTHPSPCRTLVWKHDEWRHDLSHSTGYFAANFSCCYVTAWPANRYGSSLYLFFVLASVYIAAASTVSAKASLTLTPPQQKAE